MARKVKDFKIKEFNYLSETFKETPAFNEIDWVVAEYIFSLEAVRQNKENNGLEVLNYNYGAIENICEKTGIRAKQTVINSLKKLEYLDVIKIEHSKNRHIANRYQINKKWMVQKEDLMEKVVDNIPNNEIISLLNEIINQNKELNKQVIELRNEIALLKGRNNLNDVNIEAVELPSSVATSSHIETRSSTESFFEIPNFKDSYEETIRKEEEEFDFVISSIQQATIQEGREIKEEANYKSFNNAEWNQKMEDKYMKWSYVYDKPLSKLNSCKQLQTEIRFRNDYNKPLYDLELRLKAIENKSDLITV